jgi:hypothetical protein
MVRAFVKADKLLADLFYSLRADFGLEFALIRKAFPAAVETREPREVHGRKHSTFNIQLRTSKGLELARWLEVGR